MAKPGNWDFGGWATRNDLRCADGLIIRRGAFKVNDGQKVPLVWNHKHDTVGAVLGHALLENRDEGVYAYCKFNNTPAGQNAKETVIHGDVTALSIWANNLDKVGSEVLHGAIREVSLVLAGANPGAMIESVLAHGVSIDDGEDEGIFYNNEPIVLAHADEPKKEEEGGGDVDGDKTVAEVYKTLNEEQKLAVAIIVGQAVEDAKGKNDEEEDEEMAHNLFEGQGGGENNSGTDKILSHSEMKTIFESAKRLGSFREAVKEFTHNEGGLVHAMDDMGNSIMIHSLDTTGMETATGTKTYGFNDPSMLFPDFKTLNNTPEWISRNMDWVKKVMGAVHHTPFSRIKSVFANITEDEARAKGYITAKRKKEEVFTTLKRTTTPQTIYKKQKMDRDDIIDITDFNVIEWIKGEMRVMLDEEIARAILIGDGRASDSDDKIKPENVRPVVTDVPLFNTVVKVTVPANSSQETIAKATIKSIVRSRKQYKGSGNPNFWTTDDVLTEMLLLEDGMGRDLYPTEAQLATKLRVKEIVPVEPMNGYKLKLSDNKLYPLIGTVVNLVDYNVGADKGGSVNMFEDFDIDYNQQIYLIETRISGALTKPFSALTFVLDDGSAKPESDDTTDDTEG